MLVRWIYLFSTLKQRCMTIFSLLFNLFIMWTLFFLAVVASSSFQSFNHILIHPFFINFLPITHSFMLISCLNGFFFFFLSENPCVASIICFSGAASRGRTNLPIITTISMYKKMEGYNCSTKCNCVIWSCELVADNAICQNNFFYIMW